MGKKGNMASLQNITILSIVLQKIVNEPLIHN